MTNLFYLRLFSAALPAFGHTSPLTHAAPTGLASRFRIRTRLYAAAANVNTQPTFSIPRCRTLRISAIVFSHPKHSSIRFRFFWLTSYPSCRVGPSVDGAAPTPLRVLRHVRCHLQIPAFAHEVSACRTPCRLPPSLDARPESVPASPSPHRARRCRWPGKTSVVTISPLRFSISRLPL